MGSGSPDLAGSFVAMDHNNSSSIAAVSVALSNLKRFLDGWRNAATTLNDQFKAP